MDSNKLTVAINMHTTLREYRIQNYKKGYIYFNYFFTQYDNFHYHIAPY